MNFFESAAQSFSQAFPKVFAKSLERETKKAEEERLLKQQQEADKQIMEGIQQVDAVDQDRAAGYQTLSEIRTSANLTPAARKALVKGKIKRMESQGIKLTPEFHEWLTSAKPDEMNAVLDVIFEKSQSDPNFGQQQFIDIISDPEKFTQVLSQASTQANQTLNADEESATSTSVQGKQLTGITRDMKKAQSEINILQNKRNKLVETLARVGGTATKGAIEALKLRIKQIDDKINDAQGRIQKLDERRFDIETGSKRTLRKYVSPDGQEMNVFEMNDGSFTDLKGNQIDVSDGMVVNPGTKVGQSTQPRILSPEEVKTQFPSLPDGTIVQQDSGGGITVKYTPPQDNTERTRKIKGLVQEFKSMGLDNPEEMAAKIVDGVASVKINNTTGEVLYVDEAKAAAGQEDAVTSIQVQQDMPEINPGSAIDPSIDVSEATGLGGKVKRSINVISDAIGSGLQSEAADEATSALTNLQVRTMSLMQSEVPGRPSNFLLQQLEKLTVEPNSLLQGEASSKNRLNQTKAMIDIEIGRIETSVLPLTLTQSQRQQTMINLTQLKGLKADYDQILQSFNDPASRLNKPISEMSDEELEKLDLSKLSKSQIKEVIGRLND